jgi:hypothetical protein
LDSLSVCNLLISLLRIILLNVNIILFFQCLVCCC